MSDGKQLVPQLKPAQANMLKSLNLLTFLMTPLSRSLRSGQHNIPDGKQLVPQLKPARASSSRHAEEFLITNNWPLT
eukprot:1144625-Pelagomonas_calceolata.AAC.1